VGVCTCLRIDSIDDFYAQLAADRPIGVEAYTADLAIERPYQAVAHDVALARAVTRVPELGKLTASLAFQHDHRREYDIVRDAVTGPQFDFRLLTTELAVALEHPRIHLAEHLHLTGAAGVVALAELHQYAGLPLIPDYRGGGLGVYALERLVGREHEIEAGLRYDLLGRSAALERRDFLRLVRSGQLVADACGDSAADPVRCGSRFHAVSASLGLIRWIAPAWALKLDLSTASRAPNADEQYLNGSAPTFPVLGLGKPDLGTETSYSASATSTYSGARARVEASVYASYIDDYIYFAPAIGDDGEPIFDVLIRGTFPRFATRAVDAVFYGADAGAVIAPGGGLELGAQVSIVRARNLTDASYLVLIPADRARGTVGYRRPRLGALGETFASVSGTYVGRQRRFDPSADLAPPPGAYAQLGAELGTSTRVGGQELRIALQGTNLTDARSRDYTSLLRYFADQPGRQLLLRLTAVFPGPQAPRSKGL
jgi:iron complex outermembrane receptor protein